MAIAVSAIGGYPAAFEAADRGMDVTLVSGDLEVGPWLELVPEDGPGVPDPQSLLAALYPVFKDNYGLSFAQIGLLTLTFQATASLLQPVVGASTDRRPRVSESVRILPLIEHVEDAGQRDVQLVRPFGWAPRPRRHRSPRPR